MRIIRSVLLAIVGILSIGMGIHYNSMDLGELSPYKEYGGDAFTGIQNAEVQTGGLVRLQSQLIREGIANIFIFAGLTMIVCAIPTNLKKKEG